ADIVYHADMWVIEGRRRLGLCEESLAAVRVRSHIGRQELDGCLAFQASVIGQKDFPHAAGAKLRSNSIVAYRLADHQSSFHGTPIGACFFMALGVLRFIADHRWAMISLFEVLLKVM